MDGLTNTMELTNITETNKHLIEIYSKLRENAFSSDNSFIADSPKVINLLLDEDIEVKSILATKEYYEQYFELIESKKIPLLFVATKEQMKEIVGHKIHHNAMLHGIRPKQTELDKLNNQIIMLDNITSAENVGSIARSSVALGVNSYLLPKESPHPYTRRTVRVSMGYIGKMNFHIYDDIFKTIERLKSLGYRILAGEVTEDSTPLKKLKTPEKWVLLMGHEGNGISKEILDVCDEVVTIEMAKGVKSFNVGVASSLIMYRLQN